MVKKSAPFSLFVVLVLSAVVLSACGGAINPQGIDLNNLNPGMLTGIAHSTDHPEFTGTPGIDHVQETGTPGMETEAPEASGTPEASKTPQGHGTPEVRGTGTPGEDNSHEVLGLVSAIDLTTGTITINNVTYYFTSQSIIQGTIVAGDTVRLTFGVDTNGRLIVHEVKVTDASGSSDGQGLGNGSSNEGGTHDSGTPAPGGNGGGSSDGSGG